MSGKIFQKMLENGDFDKAELMLIRSVMNKILDKGGLDLIVSGDTMITAYNHNSFDRRKSQRSYLSLIHI